MWVQWLQITMWSEVRSLQILLMWRSAVSESSSQHYQWYLRTGRVQGVNQTVWCQHMESSARVERRLAFTSGRCSERSEWVCWRCSNRSHCWRLELCVGLLSHLDPCLLSFHAMRKFLQNLCKRWCKDTRWPKVNASCAPTDSFTLNDNQVSVYIAIYNITTSTRVFAQNQW